jgi:hypothetical protein
MRKAKTSKAKTTKAKRKPAKVEANVIKKRAAAY